VGQILTVQHNLAAAAKALTPLLEIRNLTKSFDGQHAVDDVSLTIYKGEFCSTVMCGNSAYDWNIMLMGR
jgi:ABC-type phosphonate transport system ATPase subunit